jgi:hypothetical protein
MTAVIRRLVDQHLLDDAVAPTDLTDLIGAVASAEPTDIATEKGQLLYQDLMDDLRGHQRPLRVAESKRSQPR